jgi:hypothetical protein
LSRNRNDCKALVVGNGKEQMASMRHRIGGDAAEMEGMRREMENMQNQVRP